MQENTPEMIIEQPNGNLLDRLSLRARMIALGLGAALLLGACSTDGDSESRPTSPAAVATQEVSPAPSDDQAANKEPSRAVYAQTDQDTSTFEAVAEATGPTAFTLVMAFALPRKNGHIKKQAENDSLQVFAKKMTSYVGVGGWGYEGSSDPGGRPGGILKGWEGALAHPDIFIGDVLKMVKDQELEGIDLDFEFPKPEQADAFVKLVRELRKQLPEGVKISMAVPAGVTAEHAYSLDGNIEALAELVDTFRVMTYDMNGPWAEDGIAGPIASGAWTIDCLKQWVDRVGDPAKIQVGFATYGYTYVGAHKEGDQFDKEATQKLESTLFKNVGPDAKVHDNEETMTTEAMVDGSWASFQSPHIVGLIYAKAKELGISKAFFWDAAGITEEYLKAVGQ